MAKDIHNYRGDGIDVSWDKKRCLHVAECVLGLRSVFDTSKKPWVQPDIEPVNQVASVIHRCPTGALHYERKDGGPAEAPDAQNTVRVAAAGPIYVRGEIHLVAGARLRKTRGLLSAGAGIRGINRTAMDRTRVSDSRMMDEAQKAVAETIPTGKIIVTPRANGSTLFEGPVEVQSSDGRILFRGEKASLCRCGHSQTKPFCDGSHKASGFEAP